MTFHPAVPDRDAMDYRIVVRGGLGKRYAAVFEDLTLASHGGRTELSGAFVDQAHLHGVLTRLQELGVELISVNPDPPEEDR